MQGKLWENVHEVNTFVNRKLSTSICWKATVSAATLEKPIIFEPGEKKDLFFKSPSEVSALLDTGQHFRIRR